MREIKFRGKRKDNGEWVYGYYNYTVSRHIIAFEGETDTRSGATVDLKNLYGDKRVYNLVEVVPETVGQYVCNDKDGNEVYKGSRVKRVPYEGDPNPKPYQTEGRTGTVAWHHGFLQWCFLDDQTHHLDDLVDSEVFEMGLELILDNQT